MTDRIGQQLGNYRLLRLLGRGGFADVYLGEHTYLHKPAALKVLHIRLGEQETEQFLHEAQTLARLDHPHIVRVLDFAVQDGLPYLVMDYAVGGTLRTKHPASTRLPLEQVIVYISQVASALQYAHNQRLMHRDVKPENMLLDAREQVLLADFGLALLTPTHSGSTQAMDPAMAGTAPYLAPEQVQGQPRPASDQYALAVVVYEWLTGQRPFTGTPIEIAMQHVQASPPPFHDHLPDLPPGVEEVVMRALSKAPEQRFPSVQDFAAALQHAAHPASDASLTSVVPPASAATPAERTAPLRFWKVPTSFTSLVGREQDSAAICTLLSRPEVRLLTLLGVGGIGKTRLSIQVGAQVRDHFADGVCFVGLAPLSDPPLVISSIAHELGLQEAGAQPLVETVKAWLRDRQFLLLLDNFEQIVSAAPLLEDLLIACPGLIILVTSREVLRLSAEHLFPVPPLSFPDLAQLPDHKQLTEYAAVSLFLQRAQALKPDFTLTPANARAIAEICVRLDGLPLAIELAAARIRVLPPQALLTRLSQRLQVLTGGSRTLPERQQTLRNTIQWSYDLLNEQEQRLFRRLSVFVGGCTLEAAEAVCGIGSESSTVLDGVASLIDKSLVHQTEQEGEEPRLLMLETIREYGLDCLHAHGEVEAAREAHALYYLQLAEEAEPNIKGSQQSMWLERLEREHDNLRAALHWLIAQEEAVLALRLSGALWYFWYMRGYLSEGRRWLETTLGLRNMQGKTSVRAKTLRGLGQLILYQGDSLTSGPLLEESADLARELGDKKDLSRSLLYLAILRVHQGNYAAARVLIEEGVAICREVGDKWNLALSLNELGCILYKQGDDVTASDLFEQTVLLFHQIGNRWGPSRPLANLGHLAWSKGNIVRATELYKESLAIGREMSDKLCIGFVLNMLGDIALSQNENVQAAELFMESFSVVQDLGSKELIGWSLTGLAAAKGGEELQEKVIQRFENAWAQGHLITLEQALAAQGDADAAKQLVVSPRSRPYRHPVGGFFEVVQSKEAFASAWAWGRAMTPEEALAAREPATFPAELRPTAPAKSPPTYPAGLTAREVEVLHLVAQGLTDAQVAEQLVISPRTVNWHLTSIYSKLGISSRSAATRYAIEQHLV